MSGLFLRELEPLQLHPDRNTRLAAILTFRNLLYKHDVDPRYQRPEAKVCVLFCYYFIIISI